MLEGLAQALIAEHGPKALQRLVDDILQALRLGDEKTAAECERVLAQIERLAQTQNQKSNLTQANFFIV